MAVVGIPGDEGQALAVMLEHDERTIGRLLVWPEGPLTPALAALVRATAGRLEDLADRRALARALTETEAMSEDVLSQLAHELGSPLQTVNTALTLIRMRIEQSADEIPHGWLNERWAQLDRGVRRLRGLAERVATVTLRRGQPFEVRRTTVDMADVVSDVCARLRDDLAWSGCFLDVQTSGSTVGNWDPVHLETIVSNLVGNAMKYGAKRPITITVEGEVNGVRLDVRDEGCGIHPEDLPHLFERFYRGRTPTKLPGMGVGLWIVRALVDAMGGSVVVSSTPGAGTNVVVTMPRTELRDLERITPADRLD